MKQKYTKMKDEKIKLLEEFEDPRAASLAVKYGLEPREIIPNYIGLENKVKVGGGRLELDINAPNQVFEKQIKNLACAAVLCYELTKRKVVRLPVSDKTTGEFSRTEPVEIYESLGVHYEKLIDLFSSAKRELMENQ